MNLQPPTPKGGLHRTLRVLSLLLIQHALVPTGTDAHARTRLPSNPETDSSDGASRPYLKVAGARPLRFSAAPRPIPLIQAKVAVAAEPPQPLTTAESPVHPAPSTPVTETTEPVAAQPNVPTTPANDKPALSILPDDTHPSTRAEDFLPFFQFPAGDVTVVVPASAAKPATPAQLPVSSATYQQR
jgi:hypothetical protein